MDYPSAQEEKKYMRDAESYVCMINLIKEKYKEKIKILCGVEIGLMPYLRSRIKDFLSKYNFDFIIGSSYLVNGRDPFYSSFYKGREEKAAYLEYFESILENVKLFDEYDVYGHLDYVVRYGPNKNKYFNIDDYKSILEELLKIIIASEKGIELNTSGMLRGLGCFHPSTEILKMYKDLGGEVITVGSDAHILENVGYKFKIASEILRQIGFKYYSVFEGRKAVFYKI